MEIRSLVYTDASDWRPALSPIPARIAGGAHGVMTRCRLRWTYLAATAVTIGLGLGSRRAGHALPPFVSTYAGDTLWALMVYLGLGAIAPSSPLKGRAIAALLIAYAVEISQLWHPQWLDAVRDSSLGGLILGQGFLWSDIVCYTVGVACGATLDGLLRTAGRGFTRDASSPRG